MTASRFSDCSSLSQISLSAAPVLTEKDSGFSNETPFSGRDDMALQEPFSRTPKIICLPSNSARSFSESSESNVGTSHRAQGASNRTNHRTLDVPPRASTSFEDVPTTAHCTSCGTQVLTYTKHRASSMTWALTGLLCAFGCHLGCCLAPFFYSSVKDVVHLCPLCSTELGKYAQE